MTSLREINERDSAAIIYLTPLELMGVNSTQAHEFLGLEEYPRNNFSSDPLIIYRYLGTNKDNLNCDSTIIIATRMQTHNEQIACLQDKVVSLKIITSDRIPYLDLTYGSSLTDEMDLFIGERRNLNIYNVTGMDLWFEWFRDVHEDHKLDFIQNNHKKERKSRKVGTGASFPIKVYKNDAGQVGTYIGAFTADVTAYDMVTCMVVNINGDNYFQAVSTIELPGKILLKMLLS